MTGKRENFKSIGSSGLNRYGGYVNEEFLPELRYPRAARVYQEMADNDAVIGAVLYFSEMLIRGAQWRVDAASTSKEDLANKKFLEECMHDMEMSWNEFIAEALSMLVYGFSFHEIVYKVRKGPHASSDKYRSKHSDGKIGWRKLATRAQSTLVEWEFNEEGEATAFIQMAPPLFKRVRIPLKKGLLFRTRVHKNNPEGKSLLRNAYRPWYFKKKIEEIEAIGIERDLAGLPLLIAPEDMDIFDKDDEEMVMARQNAESIVKNIRNDSQAGLLLNNGWDFSLVSTGGSRTFDTNAIINRYDFRIASVLLADIILMGTVGTGSFALGDIKGNMLSNSLEAQLLNIADIINKQAVEDLFHLNNIHPKNGYPTIVPAHVKKPNVKEVAMVLRTASLDINKDYKFHNFIRDICGLDPLNEDEFEELYKAKAEAEEQAAEKPDDEKKVRQLDDPIDNLEDGSDMHYIGGEGTGGR